MKKIRYYLALIALVTTLGGLSLQGMGLAANAAANHHVSSSFVLIPHPPCVGAGGYDC